MQSAKSFVGREKKKKVFYKLYPGSEGHNSPLRSPHSGRVALQPEALKPLFSSCWLEGVQDTMNSPMAKGNLGLIL